MKNGVLIPVLLAALCYRSALSFNFSGDDFVQIVQNPLVTTHSFWAIISSPTYPGDLYRPLTLISFVVEHLAWGASPFGYHAINLSLFILSLVLITRLYGVGVAAIFSVMPIHIEAIVPVYAGRCELLAANFVLLSLIASRNNRQFLSGAALVLGILSKESAAVGPLLIALDCLYRKESLKLAVFPLGVVALALSIRAELVPPLPTDPIDNPLVSLSLTNRIQVATSLLGSYAINSLVPHTIGYDYSIGNTPASLLSTPDQMKFIAALLLLAIGLRCSPKSQAGFGILWFFIAFAVTSNYLPIGTAYGDRLAFLPSLGMAICAHYLFTASKGYKILAPTYCLVCTVITLNILPSFIDDYTLTTRRGELSPNARVLTNLAVMQRNNGDFESAILSARSALKLYPAYDTAFYVIGSIEMLRENYSAGLDAFQEALRLAPGQEQSLAALGRYYLNTGELSLAAEYFTKLLAANPTSFEARLGLAVLEARTAPESAHKKLLLLHAERPTAETKRILDALSQ